MDAQRQARFTGSAFFEALAEHKLVGSRCTTCGALYVPPRPLCPEHHGAAMEAVVLSGKGRLAAFTVVRIAPTAMLEAGYGRETPYCVGIVQLDEGPAISAQILGVDVHDPAAIAIGMPLRATFVERGEDEERRTFLAFEPGE